MGGNVYSKYFVPSIDPGRLDLGGGLQGGGLICPFCVSDQFRRKDMVCNVEAEFHQHHHSNHQHHQHQHHNHRQDIHLGGGHGVQDGSRVRVFRPANDGMQVS